VHLSIFHLSTSPLRIGSGSGFSPLTSTGCRNLLQLHQVYSVHLSIFHLYSKGISYCFIRFTVCICLSFISKGVFIRFSVCIYLSFISRGVFIRFTVYFYLSFTSKEFTTVSAGLQCASTFHYYLILVEFASAGLQCASIFHYYKNDPV
jgi:hypothetical protein